MLGFIKKNTPNFKLSEISSTDICGYRDKRLNSGVSGSSINKELNLLSRVFDIAIKEWQWMDAPNPIKQVTRPKNGKHRQRRPTPKELLRLHEECLRSGNLSVWRMIELAIETGMRRSEILSLRWENLSDQERIASLPDTKNGSKRDVPLTQKAAQVIANLPAHTVNIFPTSDFAVRHAWDRLVKRAGIDDLRFHDLRHEAVSRFFEMGLSVPEVALISGHKDYRMLARYTHMTAENVRNKLDAN